MKKSTMLALLAPALIAVLALFPYSKKETPFHSDAELEFFKANFNGKNIAHDPDFFLEIDSNILFPIAKTCGGCHGFDSLGFAFITYDGKEVNIYDDWRSTMMANSARDPFWRAKVTHEILVNPSHSLELQDKCTSCHAPAGHYQAKLKGQQLHYTLADLYQDSLGLDGVTCQACHAQPDTLLGLLNSGNLYFDTNNIRVAYGPYDFVFEPPMRDFVGITPIYSEHIHDAGVCAGCHTLITSTVDLEGEFTGGRFVEQATYHEWLNSRYDEEHDNVSCQACHVPQLEDEIIIAANYLNLPKRYPFGLHELAGANVTMLKLMKENKEALEIDAEAEHFDSTIAATLRMLQKHSLDVELEVGNLTGDTLHFSLLLQNKAGHKFPSGYPARRAWIEFELTDANGNSLFHSGAPASDYSLPDEDANFEPHHQVIRDPGQVQIYEIVPVDVNGDFTNVLERCDVAIKDNRLTPQGFLQSDPVYDTTLLVGQVLQDPDFNHSLDGTEGSGSDRVFFHIANPGYEGAVNVRARVWYQSLPPKWMAPLFEYSSPEIDSFKVMFDAADKSPVLIAEVTAEDLFTSPVSASNPSAANIRVLPTLTNDGRVRIQVGSSDAVKKVQVWSVQGQLVWEGTGTEVQLPSSPGVYFVSVKTRRGSLVQRVVRTSR
jgi:hypothetical protein